MATTATPPPVRERSLLMSGPMVRAYMAGRKGHTRRIVHPQPPEVGFPASCLVKPYCTGTAWPLAYYERRGACWHSSQPLVCHYGQPGERLCFREDAWLWCQRVPAGLTAGGRPKYRYEPLRSAPVHYCAEHPQRPLVSVVSPETGHPWGWRKKLGRYLPRWACRHVVELTGVRIERVKQITEEDAIAEGIEPLTWKATGEKGWMNYTPGLDRQTAQWAMYVDAVDSFRSLWDSLNAARGHGWEANPLVWVLTFPAYQEAKPC